MVQEVKYSPQFRVRYIRQFRSFLLIPAVVALIGLCYLYGRFVEVNWIKIKKIDIPVRDLPKSFEGFRIVQLSDLHTNQYGNREKKLPSMVNSIGADAIFITGDFADTREGQAIAGALIAQLESKYGKWGVPGNWDSNQMIKACEGAGLKMLLTDTDTIGINGDILGIMGLRFDDAVPILSTQAQREIISDLKSRFPVGTRVVLLEHAPRIIHAAQEEDIDLVLSGHTHGGQVRIPFGPAIETPSDMGIRYTKGLYKFKNTLLYINPGIGLEPGPKYIQVRFWCRPEITVITLHAV
jgi:predicted MPP superfamily phosphohydrolase